MNTNLTAADAAVNSIAAKDGLVAEQTASAVTGRYCACGCGQRLAKGSNADFAPGHDAKFVGKAIRLVVNPLDDETNADAPMLLLQEPTLNQTEDTLADDGISVEQFLSAEEVLNRRKAAVALIRGPQMGRPLLAAKVEYGVNRAIAKITRKDAREDERAIRRQQAKEKKAAKKASQPEARAYKLGRWEYPVRVTNAGQFQRNTKRDGSGTWVEADLKNGSLVY